MQEIKARYGNTPQHRVRRAQPRQQPPRECNRHRAFARKPLGREQPRQSSGGIQPFLYLIKRGIQHGAPRLSIGGVEEARLTAGQIHPGFGHIDAPDIAPVRHQILHMIEDLQSGAKRIGGRDGLRVCFIMQAQQHAPDRVS